MNFNFTSEQQLLFENTKRFIKEYYSLAQREHLLSIDQNHWSTYAELGWLAIGIPEEYSGIGRSYTDIAVFAEAIGQGMVLEPYLGAGVLAPQVILEAATSEQCAKLLPRITDGSAIFAVANAETGARGQLEFIQTTAREYNGGYIIDGHKIAVLGGPHATDFLIAARTSGYHYETDGISLFHVESSTVGIHKTNYHMIDQMAVSDLLFERVEVPASALIGELGQGFRALNRGTQTGIIAAAADAVGSMTQALSQTCAFLKMRKQFDSPLSNFQVLRHRVADMTVALELAKSSLLRGLAGLENPDDNERAKAVSSTRIMASRASRVIGGQAIQLHGGIGITKECAVGQHFNHLSVLNALFGTEDYHIAKLGALI